MQKRVIFSLFALTLAGCSNQQFTKGDYDDPEQVRLLDDKFNESDAAMLAEDMILSMAANPIFADAKVPPVVQVETLRNKTTEHIDTKSITDSIRTSLIKTGKVRFANKEDRDLVESEVDYQQDSGRVNRTSQKKRGNSVGADYVLTGDLVSNVQEVGNRKLVFYKLTLNLTNLTTNLIDWSDAKPIRKRFKKKAVGL